MPDDVIDEPIVRLAASGEGLTASGRRIPLSAPADLVQNDGTVLPGPHHATPPCRHFPTCGGCQVQHIDDAAYADFLIERITSALHAQRLDVPEIRTPHLSPPFARRRASLRAERRGQRVQIGFNEEHSHRLVDLAECWVLHPTVFALVAPLRSLLAGLIPDRRAAEVQMTLSDQGIDLLLGGIDPQGLAAAEAMIAFAQRHGLARLSIDGGDGPESRWEPEPVTVTLGGTAVGLPAGGFLQATADGEAALVAAVREGVGDARVVADLFAGLGTFALALPGRVLAAEGDRAAALALKAAGAGRVVADHRDLFRRPYTAADLSRFDAVVLDPPRAGAKDQVVELARATCRRIAYVSCNPATFARDAKTLCEAGWRLEWIRPVGQFRWSTHVELAAAFTR